MKLKKWEIILQARSEAFKKIEEMRAEKIINQSSECDIVIIADEHIIEALKSIQEDLAGIFMVSKVTLNLGKGLSASASKTGKRLRITQKGGRASNPRPHWSYACKKRQNSKRVGVPRARSETEARLRENKAFIENIIHNVHEVILAVKVEGSVKKTLAPFPGSDSVLLHFLFHCYGRNDRSGSFIKDIKGPSDDFRAKILLQCQATGI